MESCTVTILSGDTTANVGITISGDADYEENETFNVTISSASKGNISDSDGTCTINNDDSQPIVTLSAGSVTIAENGGVSTITAALSAKSYEIVTIDLGFSGTASAGDYSKSSVIYNPKTFKDVENHWEKEVINDMGSRLVISGVGKDRFEPDRDITAAIAVKALGLMRPGAGKSTFSDVTKDSGK